MQLKLTPEVADRIVNFLKLGNYQETAAAAAGIDAGTLRKWLRRGASGEEEPYASFCARVHEAEASAESRHVGTLFSASREDWRAAAWILSRKAANRWGDRVQVQVDTAEQMKRFIDIAAQICDAETFPKLLEALAEEPAVQSTGLTVALDEPIDTDEP